MPSNISFEADGSAAAQLKRYASMNQHSRPIWFAVLVTPWAVPLALVSWAVLSLLFTEGTNGLRDWPVLSAFFVFCLPVTYATMLIFGLPCVMWLRSRGKLTGPLVCIGATLASAVVVPAYFWLVDPQIAPIWSGILLLAALGLFSGMVFCIAAGITIRPSGRRTGAA